jgi:hypothetical protein
MKIGARGGDITFGVSLLKMPSALEFLKLQIFAVSVFRPCSTFINAVQFRSHRASRPSRNADINHRAAPPIDPCFNELTNPGALCSIGRIVAFGFGCHGCGRVGVPLSSSSSLKPSSAGIIKDSDGIGLGRFVMGGLDDLAFRRKRAISSGQ